MADEKICNVPVDLSRDLQGAWSTSIVTPRDPSDLENRDRYPKICVEMMKWILEKKFSDPILSRALLCISTIPMPCSHAGACEEHDDEDSSGETCYKAQYKKCLAALGDRVLEYEKIREKISAAKTSEEEAILKETNLMDPHLDIMLEIVKPFNELGADAQITKLTAQMNTPELLEIRRKLQDLYGFAPRAMLYTLKGKEMIDQGKWCVATKKRRENIHGDTYKRHPWATEKKPAQVKLQPVPSIRADANASTLPTAPVDAEPLSGLIDESSRGVPSSPRTTALPGPALNSSPVTSKQRQTPLNKPEAGSVMDVDGFEIVRGPKKGKQPVTSATVTPSKPRRSLVCMTMEEQVEILFSGQGNKPANGPRAAEISEQDDGDTELVVQDVEPIFVPSTTKGTKDPDSTGQQVDPLGEDQAVASGFVENEDLDYRVKQQNGAPNIIAGGKQDVDSIQSPQRHANHRVGDIPITTEAAVNSTSSASTVSTDKLVEMDVDRPDDVVRDSQLNVEEDTGAVAHISEEPVRIDPTHDQNDNKLYGDLDTNALHDDAPDLGADMTEAIESANVADTDQSRQQDIEDPVDGSKRVQSMGKTLAENAPPQQLSDDRKALISVDALFQDEREESNIPNMIKADTGPLLASTTGVATEEPRGKDSVPKGRKRSREEPKPNEDLAGRDGIEIPLAFEHPHADKPITANSNGVHSKPVAVAAAVAAAIAPTPPSAATPPAGPSQPVHAAASVEHVSHADLSVVTEADLEHFYQEPRQYLNLFSKSDIYTPDFLRQTISPQNAAVIVRFQRNDPTLVKHVCSSRIADGIFEIPLEVLEKGVDRKKQKVAGWESLPKEQQQGLFEAVAYLKLTVMPQRQWQKVKKVRPLTFL